MTSYKINNYQPYSNLMLLKLMRIKVDFKVHFNAPSGCTSCMFVCGSFHDFMRVWYADGGSGNPAAYVLFCKWNFQRLKGAANKLYKTVSNGGTRLLLVGRLTAGAGVLGSGPWWNSLCNLPEWRSAINCLTNPGVLKEKYVASINSHKFSCIFCGNYPGSTVDIYLTCLLE